MSVDSEQAGVIESCLTQLDELMVIFRTYSGRRLLIDRGDFDVEFFRNLHAACEKVSRALKNLKETGVPKDGVWRRLSANEGTLSQERSLQLRP